MIPLLQELSVLHTKWLLFHIPFCIPLSCLNELYIYHQCIVCPSQLSLPLVMKVWRNYHINLTIMRLSIYFKEACIHINSPSIPFVSWEAMYPPYFQFQSNFMESMLIRGEYRMVLFGDLPKLKNLRQFEHTRQVIWAILLLAINLKQSAKSPGVLVVIRCTYGILDIFANWSM